MGVFSSSSAVICLLVKVLNTGDLFAPPLLPPLPPSFERSFFSELGNFGEGSDSVSEKLRIAVGGLG